MKHPDVEMLWHRDRRSDLDALRAGLYATTELSDEMRRRMAGHVMEHARPEERRWMLEMLGLVDE
jgi:hypothetical protein